MRTLHLYITRQILGGLVMTVLVFTFVLLLGNVLKEVLALLISGQATLGLVARALALLIPFVLVFALPMGLLTATLLVFGRLSADQELTAARAGGISLVVLASPVFLLGAAASCLSAWTNLDLAPRARTAYKELFQRVDFAQMQSFFSDQVDAFRLSYRPRTGLSRRTQISDMTFLELTDTLRQLEAVGTGLAPPAGATSDQLREHRRRINEIRTELTAPVRVHLHRQVAFSFACLGFTLVGVPLGVRAHRRETSAGIAMALLLVAVYYAFVILAQSLQNQPQYGPHLILWIPNFIFQVAGAALLWRANRGI